MLNNYLPEGYLFGTRENKEYVCSPAGLEKAAAEGKILEGTVTLCDNKMRLHVDLYGTLGIIDKNEAVFLPDGAPVKDIAIITRVGKPVCFKVMGFSEEGGKRVAVLSRREAQKEALSHLLYDLAPGDVVLSKVTHLDTFGAFVDIGCGVVSLLPIDSISVSRISHPSDRLHVGDKIYTVIKTVNREDGKIFVSMKELLGTWQENADMFEVGQTVAGIVRSIESYGIFIELAPNLAGLAEIRDGDSGTLSAKVGERAAVYIKSIIPDKMKIKLVLIDTYGQCDEPTAPKYYVDLSRVTHIDRWLYSPPSSQRIIETVF